MGEYHRDPEIRAVPTKFRRRQDRKADLTVALIIVLVIAGTVLLLTAHG